MDRIDDLSEPLRGLRRNPVLLLQPVARTPDTYLQSVRISSSSLAVHLDQQLPCLAVSLRLPLAVIVFNEFTGKEAGDDQPRTVIM